MNNTADVNAENIHTFTNRFLVIKKHELENQYTEATNRFARHGWQSGFDNYCQVREDLIETISLINDELWKRWEYDKAMHKALDEARAAVVREITAA